MNKLANVIGEFQSELMSGIPRVIELLVDREFSVRSGAVCRIMTLGKRGKSDKNGKGES
jgi:hypothetical protein